MDGSGRGSTGDAATPDISDRRAVVVEVYCREVCDSRVATEAASESIAAFARAVGERAADDDRAGDLELMRITREVAAEYAAAWAGTRRWRAKLRGPRARKRDRECHTTFGLLADRFNQLFSATDTARLEVHLDRCRACRKAESRAARAERVCAWMLGPATATEGLRNSWSVVTPLRGEASHVHASAPPRGSSGVLSRFVRRARMTSRAR
jgi:hypothetical protein